MAATAMTAPNASRTVAPVPPSSLAIPAATPTTAKTA